MVILVLQVPDFPEFRTAILPGFPECEDVGGDGALGFSDGRGWAGAAR